MMHSAKKDVICMAAQKFRYSFIDNSRKQILLSAILDANQLSFLVKLVEPCHQLFDTHHLTINQIYGVKSSDLFFSFLVLRLLCLIIFDIEFFQASDFILNTLEG